MSWWKRHLLADLGRGAYPRGLDLPCRRGRELRGVATAAHRVAKPISGRHRPSVAAGQCAPPSRGCVGRRREDLTHRRHMGELMSSCLHTSSRPERGRSALDAPLRRQSGGGGEPERHGPSAAAGCRGGALTMEALPALRRPDRRRRRRVRRRASCPAGHRSRTVGVRPPAGPAVASGRSMFQAGAPTGGRAAAVSPAAWAVPAGSRRSDPSLTRFLYSGNSKTAASRRSWSTRTSGSTSTRSGSKSALISNSADRPASSPTDVRLSR